MIYKQLLDNGFKQSGNWYIKELISVNLFTKEIKCNNSKILFSYFEKNITVELLNKINKLLCEII